MKSEESRDPVLIKKLFNIKLNGYTAYKLVVFSNKEKIVNVTVWVK